MEMLILIKKRCVYAATTIQSNLCFKDKRTCKIIYLLFALFSGRMFSPLLDIKKRHLSNFKNGSDHNIIVKYTVILEEIDIIQLFKKIKIYIY